MGTVTLAAALAAEKRALSAGWTERQLLDEAGERLGHSLARFFPIPGSIVAYLGKGHNAGDALVALRILRGLGWSIHLRAAWPMEMAAPLTVAKWRELDSLPPMSEAPAPPDAGPWVLLDALTGTGSRGALREPLAALASEMEVLRQTAGARVAAVDLPSGMDADRGTGSDACVTADVTFMIGNAKRGLLDANASNRTGALVVVPMPALEAGDCADIELIHPAAAAYGKAPRPFDFHKGSAGRVAVLAGSSAYPGAAVLAATGALRGGAGLVTLWLPEAAIPRVMPRLTPEVMVRSYRRPIEVREARHDVLVTGCGLGGLEPAAADDLVSLLDRSDVPTVIDADALNTLARLEATGILKPHHLLTPHPGEFARLAPDLAHLPREAAARQFADRTSAVLLLKGCRTLVTAPGLPLRANSTGTPAMASGGHGDLLAGVAGALAGSGMALPDAASLAAWACGRSAEIAMVRSGHSEESLLPTDLLPHLGAAFLDWRFGRR